MVTFTVFFPNNLRKLIEVQEISDIHYFVPNNYFAHIGNWIDNDYISWDKKNQIYVIQSEMKFWSVFFGMWSGLRPNGVSDNSVGRAA